MTETQPQNPWLANRSGTKGEAYDAAFDRRATAGEDVHGEASFVEALGPASVLDAGCGTGRVAIELARRGVEAVGVDLDPAMLAVARRKGPDLTWVEGDLTTIELGRRFDVVLTAGNVMIFLTPGTEREAVTNVARHLEPDGRFVAGFSLSADRLTLADFDDHCAAAGLVTVKRFATWDRAPYDGGDYAVTLCAPARRPGAGAQSTSAETPGGA